MTPEYDFTFTDDNSTEDPRPNLRIAKCCGNCKYFWYKKNKQRRGFCRIPNPHLKFVAKRLGESYDENEIRKNWAPAHVTNTCDLHRFTSIWSSINRVSDWVGKKFNAQGALEE
jgi:hypothetical protein